MPDGALETKLAAQSRKSKKVTSGFAVVGLVVAIGLAVAVYFLLDDAPVKKVTQSVVSAPSNEDADISQAQFRDALAQYENEIEATLNWLAGWNVETHAQVENLKATALEDFARGQFSSAWESLQRARELVAAAQADYDTQLTTARQNARATFADARAPEATAAVATALRLKPDDAEMLALEKRVAVLTEVLALQRRAQIAQTENRPEKEIAALEEMLTLDPSRTEVKPRIAELETQLAEQRFTAAMQKARQALSDDDATTAAQQINIAKKIFPKHPDLKQLQTQLAEARARAEIKKQVALGVRAKSADDWHTAHKHFQRALQLNPSHQTAVENYALAQRVLDVDKKIRRHLAQPARLGDKNVLASVIKFAQTSADVTELSPKLAAAHSELTKTLTAYQTEVPVTVVSDNKTYIIVRGEGHVGETERRTIQLRPGTRVFEGTRVGYKSKLVTVDIAPASSGVEVTVICDEKI